ncbi:hypothetical protein BsWGS_17568 [Bradybaena similaris]
MSAQLTLLTALGCLLVSGTRVQGKILPVKDFPTSYDAVYDFQSSYNNIVNEHVTQVVGFSGSGCATQGVLKLALASAAVDPNRRRVKVDLFMDGGPTGWVFNLGDSSTNDGYGGDGSTQSWDAEVHGVVGATGPHLTGWYSDNGGSGQAFHIPKQYTSGITLVAGDGHAIWRANNETLYTYFYSPYFFGLNGQADSTGPVNYDLHLGINRVIGGSHRTGSGVCKVGIKFLPDC